MQIFPLNVSKRIKIKTFYTKKSLFPYQQTQIRNISGGPSHLIIKKWNLKIPINKNRATPHLSRHLPFCIAIVLFFSTAIMRRLCLMMIVLTVMCSINACDGILSLYIPSELYIAPIPDPHFLTSPSNTSQVF